MRGETHCYCSLSDADFRRSFCEGLIVMVRLWMQDRASEVGVYLKGDFIIVV